MSTQGDLSFQRKAPRPPNQIVNTLMLFARGGAAVSVLAVAVALAGCDMVDQVKEGMARSSATSESIAKQVGKKPQVGFNYNNGSFTQATVQFSEAPALPLPELEKVVRVAVVNEFTEEPATLVIAFSYSKAK